ncbi:MAG: hypothetical protein ACYCX2_06960 [Christensenellales bacterium]
MAGRKRCVLDESKVCTSCGECDICDLDPDKLCDNCGKCLQLNADYKEILIDAVISDQDEEFLYLDELKDPD